MPSRAGACRIDPQKLKSAVKRLDEQLARARESAEQLQESKSQYDDLQSVLEGLPEKISHPVMVPYGPLAFFEGHLEHTNEILVQLSSEWFVLKTPKHALGTVERRRNRLSSELQNVEREMHDLQEQLRLTATEGAASGVPMGPHIEGEHLLDIREPIDEDEERASATITRGVDDRITSRDLLDDSHSSDVQASAAPGVDFTRLRDLERLESGKHVAEDDERIMSCGIPGTTITRDADGYLDIREPFLEESIATAPVMAGASLRSDVPSIDRPNLARLRELELLEEEDELAQLDDIFDAYENVSPVGASHQAPASSPHIPKDEAGPEMEVRSPADIFRLMSQIEGSSKSAGAASSTTREGSSSGSVGSAKESEFAPPLRSAAAQAFAGEIREHALPANSSNIHQEAGHKVSGDHGTSALPTSAVAAPKRVSKFKADRQNTSK